MKCMHQVFWLICWISVQVIDLMSTSGYFRMEIFVYTFDFYASSSKWITCSLLGALDLGRQAKFRSLIQFRYIFFFGSHHNSFAWCWQSNCGKLCLYDLGVVSALKPNIIILDIGPYDLVNNHPEIIGSEIDDLEQFLFKPYSVCVIGVCEVIPPVQAPFFNAAALILNQYLNNVLELLPKVFSWHHMGFCNPTVSPYLGNGSRNLSHYVHTSFTSGIICFWFDLFPEFVLFICVLVSFYNEPLSLMLHSL